MLLAFGEGPFFFVLQSLMLCRMSSIPGPLSPYDSSNSESLGLQKIVTQLQLHLVGVTPGKDSLFKLLYNPLCATPSSRVLFNIAQCPSYLYVIPLVPPKSDDPFQKTWISLPFFPSSCCSDLFSKDNIQQDTTFSWTSGQFLAVWISI